MTSNALAKVTPENFSRFFSFVSNCSFCCHRRSEKQKNKQLPIWVLSLTYNIAVCLRNKNLNSKRLVMVENIWLLFSVLGGPFTFFEKGGQILLKEDIW